MYLWLNNFQRYIIKVYVNIWLVYTPLALTTR